MKKILSFVILSMFALTIGCSQHLGNFTALSTSAYNPEKIDNKHLVAKNATGETQSFMFMGIPIGGIPKVDQAVSEALSQNNGDFMKNARLYSTAWSAIIIGGIGYKVEGDVYNTQD